MCCMGVEGQETKAATLFMYQNYDKAKKGRHEERVERVWK